MHARVIMCLNQHNKFEVSVPSFTNSKGMTGATKRSRYITGALKI